MFCVNCGSRLIDGKPFCPNCGTRADSVQGTQAAQNAQPVQSAVRRPAPYPGDSIKPPSAPDTAYRSYQAPVVTRPAPYPGDINIADDNTPSAPLKSAPTAPAQSSLEGAPVFVAPPVVPRVNETKSEEGKEWL